MEGPLNSGRVLGSGTSSAAWARLEKAIVHRDMASIEISLSFCIWFWFNCLGWFYYIIQIN